MYEDSEFGTPEWRFGTTPWSDILSARDLTKEERAQCLSFLAKLYWRPVYYFICRHGMSPDDARDHTQSFFVMMLETDFVNKADPTRGKFRTYMLTALTRFLSKQYQRERRMASSLSRETLFLARMEDEALPPDKSITPQEEFDCQWARMVINTVLGRLEERYRQKGEEAAFNIFARRLLGSFPSSYGANKLLASEFGLSQRQVENAYRKCLRWYRDLFRQEVRAYVRSDAEVEEEIEDLWKLLK